MMIRSMIILALVGMALGKGIGKVEKEETLNAIKELAEYPWVELLQSLDEKMAIGGGPMRSGHIETKSALKVRAKWNETELQGMIDVDVQFEKPEKEADGCYKNGGCWFSVGVITPTVDENDPDELWKLEAFFERRVSESHDQFDTEPIEFNKLSAGVYEVEVCRITGPRAGAGWAHEVVAPGTRCNCWECGIHAGMSEDMWGFRGCGGGTHCAGKIPRLNWHNEN